MTPSIISEQDRFWVAIHQEREQLRGRLGIPIYDENPSWGSLERQLRERRDQGNPSVEEERAYGRLRQVEAEISTLRAEWDRRSALAREADEARRHIQTAYTPPLPRIIDGYLTFARRCPTCATPPEQLRWTHHVQIHSAFGGNFNTSWWVTDCLICGTEVETIPECAG